MTLRFLLTIFYIVWKRVCRFKHNICLAHFTYSSTICTSPGIRYDIPRRTSHEPPSQACFFFPFLFSARCQKRFKILFVGWDPEVSDRGYWVFRWQAFGYRTAFSSVQLGGVRKAIHQLNRVLSNAPRISIIGFRSSKEKAIWWERTCGFCAHPSGS